MAESTTSLASLLTDSQVEFQQISNFEQFQSRDELQALQTQSVQANFQKNPEESVFKVSRDSASELRKMIISNLIDFVTCNLDKKLDHISKLIERNNLSLKKAQINYDKAEKKILAYKVSQGGGAIQDSIKCYFEMIKRTSLKLDDENLKNAAKELIDINAESEGCLTDKTIDCDRTYSDEVHLTKIQTEETLKLSWRFQEGAFQEKILQNKTSNTVTSQ